MVEQKGGQDSLAILEKNTIGVVAERIKEYQKKKQLFLPPNYSPENALKSAFLTLQETKDRNDAPVLQTCTRISIANSLLDMVIQGLNPAKKQCYFIAYGKKLTCMRSYMGSMDMVKNIAGAKDVYAEVIYQGDEFTYEIKNGNKKVVKHVQKFGNIAPEKIAGAYCTIIFDDREFTEVMTIEQIRKSWKKSKMDTTRVGSTHKEFPEEMVKRTVINRACKRYINSSSDNVLLQEAMSRTEEIATDEEVAEEKGKEANKEIIDIEIPKPSKEEAEKPTIGVEPESKPKEWIAREKREAERRDLFNTEDRNRKPDF